MIDPTNRLTRIKDLWQPPLRGYVILVMTVILGFGAVHYQDRLGQTNSSRQGCERGIKDRLDQIKLITANINKAKINIKADKYVVAHKELPLNARLPRKAEYEAEEVTLAEYEGVKQDFTERVDPLHGGKLVCSSVYPSPSPLP